MSFHARSLVLGLVLGGACALLFAWAPPPQAADAPSPPPHQAQGRYWLVAVEPANSEAARVVRLDTVTGEVAHLVWQGDEDGRYVLRR